MKRVYKRIFFLILCISGLVRLQCISSGLLRPVYAIEQAEGVDFPRRFSGYEDSGLYGNMPKTLNPEDLVNLNSVINWADPASWRIQSSKRLYVAHLANAYVSPAHLGTIFTATQQFLFDIKVHPGQAMFWRIDHNVQVAHAKRHAKIATVQGPTLFYHWVIDRMPSIFMMRDLIRNDPEMKLIINSYTGRVASYVYEYLDLLGIPLDKCLQGDPGTIYYADNLWFATPFLMEPIPQALLLAMRETLIDEAMRRPMSRAYKNNLIVVIQRTEPDRRIANLSELLASIKQTFMGQDVEIVVFDASTSVAEQICIFNNARVVIGAMASGLTNVVYTNPRTTVIELHPESRFISDAAGINNYGGEWCWWLASAVGANYWMIPVAFSIADPWVYCPMDRMQQVLTTVAQNMLLQDVKKEM